ncbi:MAG: undecaprenyl-diphosphate phosphatase, partial [Actinomycetes bacterium]
MESWFHALVYGLVQGLTEFLPISSSAHLRITAAVAGWEDPGAAFTAVTQLGTETAVLLYFRNEIWNILRTWTLSLFRPDLRGELGARMGWYVIVGTLPIGVLGFVFQDEIEGPARNLW